MKRKYFAMLALILAVVMAVPTVVIADTQEPQTVAQDTQETQDTQEAQEGPFDHLRMITPTPGAIEIALADFDYIAEIILETLPTRGVFDRRFPGELTLFLDLARNLIEEGHPQPAFIDMEILWGAVRDYPATDDLGIAAEYLYSVLLHTFGLVLGSFGHMGPQSASEFERLLTLALIVEYVVDNNIELEDSIYGAIAFAIPFIDVLLNPAALYLYGFNPEDIDATDFGLLLTAGLAPIEGNITTEIISPDRIAYVHIASFLSDPIADGQILTDFFEQVQHFDHLIIDVRGNMGGIPTTIFENIVGGLIEDQVYFNFTEFFSSSIGPDLIRRGNYHSMVVNNAIVDGIFPASQYVYDNYLPNFNMDDLEYFQYAVRWTTPIAQSENATPFAGDIWLLTDGMSASASEMLTFASLYTGFATTVGEPTAGVMGVTTNYTILPQTGLMFRIDIASLADPTGRALEEYGIVPMIPNAEGLDAFGTVLSIIAPELLEIHLANITAQTVEQLFGDINIIEIDGTTFIPIRAAAYAQGWQVQWDDSINSAILTDLQGNTWTIASDEAGAFITEGRLHIELENAIMLFTATP